MKLILFTLLFSVLGFSQICAQANTERNNAIFLRSDLVVFGSETFPRFGIGIGYGYFYKKMAFKAFVEASRRNNSNQLFREIDSKFRIKGEVEYRINNFFSLSAFGAPTARYYSYYNYSSGPDYRYLTDFSIGLGITPSLYRKFGRLFMSIGTNIPLIEIGQFIVDKSDPQATTAGFISEEFTARLFYKEIEGVFTLGFLF